jgi:hypothetical protein
VVVVEIIGQLLFAPLVITVSSPYLQFHDILTSTVVYDDISARQVAGLCFAVVIANAIDDRPKVCEEQLSSIVLHKAIVMARTEGLVEVVGESLYYPPHIKFSVMDELIVVFLSLSKDFR